MSEFLPLVRGLEALLREYPELLVVTADQSNRSRSTPLGRRRSDKAFTRAITVSPQDTLHCGSYRHRIDASVATTETPCRDTNFTGHPEVSGHNVPQPNPDPKPRIGRTLCHATN